MSSPVLFDDLLRKYDVPVPRYTSYPTVPFWDTGKFSMDQWVSGVRKCFQESNAEKGISLYIHLPFCESLCTYCACNTRITKNHRVEDRYRKTVLKEWSLYKALFPGAAVVRELHLGGGTPTFFSATNLRQLVTGLLDGVVIHQEAEFSFEGHPNNTTAEHLQTLFDLGFRRVSYGVQDLDERVQQAIHRIQPFENLTHVTNLARAIGYTSVSFDLIYGLPYQTINSIKQTISQVITLTPNRLAFYSYAHVPWLRPGQRGYEDADLPGDILKRSLYETGRKLFMEAGYQDIGMDHFALPEDTLAFAHRRGDLHRNFMGYTTSSTDLLIGLGASSISDARYAYAQNNKKVEDYEAAISEGNLAIFKGHIQTEKDLLVKRCILDIACKGFLPSSMLSMVLNESQMEVLRGMDEEGIITLSTAGLQVTPLGHPFVRNICSVFDERLNVAQQERVNLFSKAI